MPDVVFPLSTTVSSLTSDSEFDLVKRVQITNEVPPSALWTLLPTGLRNDFWKYFIGTSEVVHGVTEEHGDDIYTSIRKTVNGVQSPVYGPPPSDILSLLASAGHEVSNFLYHGLGNSGYPQRQKAATGDLSGTLPVIRALTPMRNLDGEGEGEYSEESTVYEVKDTESPDQFNRLANLGFFEVKYLWVSQYENRYDTVLDHKLGEKLIIRYYDNISSKLTAEALLSTLWNSNNLVKYLDVLETWNSQDLVAPEPSYDKIVLDTATQRLRIPSIYILNDTGIPYIEEVQEVVIKLDQGDTKDEELLQLGFLSYSLDLTNPASPKYFIIPKISREFKTIQAALRTYPTGLKYKTNGDIYVPSYHPLFENIKNLFPIAYSSIYVSVLEALQLAVSDVYDTKHAGDRHTFSALNRAKAAFTSYLASSKIDTIHTENARSALTAIVNALQALENQGTSGSSYHSIALDGVILPEIDLFLHEIYRYLDHLYPDHPDYAQLLTATELNDAFYAAAAIIGYAPDYRFLEKWSQSITGTALTREELKWKIRDLRSAAFRRKFSGSYVGYKLVFSSMYRHGAVYPTGTYIPKTADGEIDVTSENLFRRFRLIDMMGDNISIFRESAQIEFNGIVDPSNLLRVYESDPQNTLSDTSALPRVSVGAFVYDKNQVLAPAVLGNQSGVTVQSAGTLPAGYVNYQTHYFQTSNTILPSVREYNILRNGSSIGKLNLTPRPFGNPKDITERALGRFSLPVDTASRMYPSDLAPLSNISHAPFGEGILQVGDTIQDDYIVGVFPRKDFAVIQKLVPGHILLVMDPNRSAILQTNPPQDILYSGINIHVPQQNGTIKDVFLQGTVSFTINSISKPTQALFQIKNIPEVHPLTGEAGNREALKNINSSYASSPSIAIGQTADFYYYDSVTLLWTQMVAMFGWLNEIEYGYVETKEASRDGVMLSDVEFFTVESFSKWKKRCSSIFLADLLALETESISGTVSESNPKQINITGGNAERTKAEGLSVGDAIRGPGIIEGTVISSASADYITISEPATRFGSFTYVLTLKRGYAVKDPQILNFKNIVYSRFPALSSSAFAFLWPSKIWPDISQGYLEGIKDVALYKHPTKLPPGIDYPANIFYDRDIFLDLSLDRVLLHPNTLERKVNGVYSCLCDLPWLEYIEAFVSQAKRATEQVHVGVQLNLTADLTGLYSVVEGNYYSDNKLQAKFITLPNNYNQNNTPKYVQLGTGGAAKSSLFVSIDDLVRPTIYGSAFYDIQRDEGENEKRRSTYLASGSGGVSTSTNAITSFELELPVFETPIGEYENLIGLVPDAASTNSYHAITTTVHSQQFKNIETELTDGNALVVNSPALVELKRLPDTWHDKGTWIPATVPNQPTEPQWPAATAINDYYVVTQSTSIGPYTFTKDDWIIWNGTSWDIRTWVLQGMWEPTGSGATTVALPPLSLINVPEDSDLPTVIATQFPYFILPRACTITDLNGGTEVDVGDWLVLTGLNSPTSGQWVVANGKCLGTLNSSIARYRVPAGTYSVITQSRAALVDTTVSTYQLPRRFLARGSCKFRIRLDPHYTAIDHNGQEYELTESPLYFDDSQELFYTLNGNVRHYVKFREPKYFKNLGLFTGKVSKSNPEILQMVEGLDFPISKLSLKDTALSGLQVQVRNAYDPTLENKFFNHYVSLIGIPDSSNRKILRPITGTGTDSDAAYLAEFQAAIDRLSVYDSVHASTAATIRQYSTLYENIYYKNLLALAGTVRKDSPTLLRPLGTGDDDIRAFTDAIKLLKAGDYAVATYTLGGDVFLTTTGDLPFPSVRTVACNKSATPTWVAGGSGGGLAKSTDGTSWTSVLVTGWGTGTINKIVFATSATGAGQWRIVGDGGKCAYSLDNGETWTIDPLAGSGWGTSNIYALDYYPTTGTWVIGGADGKAAYFVEGTTTWVATALPGADGAVVPLPPGAPSNIPAGTQGIPSGWGNSPVRAVAQGNGVWMIGGGNNVAGSDTISLLARSTNLTPSDGSAIWTFAYMGASWGDNYIADIAYGAETGLWVAVGSGGAISYSTNDGVSWASITLPAEWGTSDIYDVSFDYGTWTIVGASGKVATSTNGITWTMGSTTTSLGTTTLWASAHGATTQGIEHIIVGATNKAAYSNSVTNSIPGLTVITTSSEGTLSVELDSAITTWAANDTSISKTVLLSFNTVRSVSCELLGIPTSRIPSFVKGNGLMVPTTVVTSSYATANRVHFPHLDPAFNLDPLIDGLTSAQIRNMAGYPLYEEDASAYYLTSAGEPVVYSNVEGDPIYFCNKAGEYVSGDYATIPATDFVAITATADGQAETQFLDPRQASYTPRYSFYKDWIQHEGALADAGTITFTSTISFKGEDYITFQSAIPTLPAGANVVQLTLMPAVAAEDIPTPEVDTFPEYIDIATAKVNLPITGMYIPDGGYGTWLDFDSTMDTRLPWQTDPAAFLDVGASPIYLRNINDQPVYLCDKTGAFKLNGNNRIRIPAPKYLSFQELTTESRIVEGSEIAIAPDTYVVGADSTTNMVAFSKPLVTFSGTEVEKYVQIRLLTVASFSTTDNDVRNIVELAQKDLTKYALDRVYQDTSAYPAYATSPELYESGLFVNANGYAVYLCDANGAYKLDNSSTRIQPQMPIYKLCQDWYKDTAYVKGQEDNPYWQYIILQDKLNEKSKLWDQEAYLAKMVRSEFGGEMVPVKITDGSNLLTVRPGLEYRTDLNYFQITTSNYIKYKDGQLSMILLANPIYDKAINPDLETEFEKYGISFTSHFEPSLFSHTEINHSTVSGTLISSYYVNTTQNFADRQDHKSPIVAITELGVFNTDDQMIAYGVFPPIIYDSSRHHLSLNLFIKQGEFTTT